MFSGEPVEVCLRGRDMPVMIVSYQGGLEVMRRVLCSRRNKEVAGGSAFTRPCGAWPCGFSVMWPPCRVRAVPCLHLSRAGRDARVRFAAAVTRSLLPVCRDFPVVHPLRFRGLTLQLPSAVRVGLRLSLRPCIPAGPAKMEARHRPVSQNI